MIKKTKVLLIILFLAFALIFSGCEYDDDDDDYYGSKYDDDDEYSQRKSIKTTTTNNVQPIKAQSKPQQKTRIQTRTS